MKVVYSGGGTVGTLAPLLAVHQELKNAANYRAVWIGLGSARELALTDGRGFETHTVVSPRFRNFEGQGFGLTQLTFPFRFFFAFVQALAIIGRTRSDVHVSAGSFVSIPVACAARVLGVPTVVHQLDLKPGLANRVMAKIASRVTVAFPELAEQFGKKAVVTGNPVRAEIFGGDAERARARCNLPPRPTVLIIGGSSGAEGLNALVEKSLDTILSGANVLHMTGKPIHADLRPNYRQVEFFGPEINDAYALADIVVARAGIGTISELGMLGKPMILVPIPGSHQEQNAEYFVTKGAALFASQSSDPITFAKTVLDFLENLPEHERLVTSARKLFPTDAAHRVASVISEVVSV